MMNKSDIFFQYSSAITYKKLVTHIIYLLPGTNILSSLKATTHKPGTVKTTVPNTVTLKALGLSIYLQPTLLVYNTHKITYGYTCKIP